MLFTPGVTFVMFSMLITAVPLVMFTVLFWPFMMTVTLPVAFSGPVMIIVPLPVSFTLKSLSVVVVLLTAMYLKAVVFSRYL